MKRLQRSAGACVNSETTTVFNNDDLHNSIKLNVEDANLYEEQL